MFLTIKAYNEYLSNNLKNLNINQYFKELHKQFYSELDISFMDYFLELCDEENLDKFCVEHEKLKEFGIITTGKTDKIIRCLEQCNFIKNQDYVCLTIDDIKSYTNSSSSDFWGPNIGAPEIMICKTVIESIEIKDKMSHKLFYILKPKAFKECLMNCKNTNKYRQYYLLLEQTQVYYYSYQIMYHKVLLSGKDEKIDTLQGDVNKLLIDNKDLKGCVNDLMNSCKNLAVDNKDLKHSCNKLMVYAEDSNNRIRNMEITINELVNIVKTMLSSTFNLMYSINENMKQTKVLIVYILLNEEDPEENDFKLVFRYAQLSGITKSFKDMMAKSNNEHYKIYDLDVLGPINDNMLTLQKLGRLVDLEKMNKEISGLTDLEVDEVIDSVKAHIQKNKRKFFEEKIKENEILSEQSESLNQTIRIEAERFNSINELIYKFVSEKAIQDKNFRCSKLCCELKKNIGKF